MNRDNFFKTNLKGRLKKITLSSNDCFLPIFECVVNSIQSIEERALSDKKFSIKDGKIDIEFVYDDKQIGKDWSETPITGFKVSDNGCGFNSKNYDSFKTFDSDYKEEKGCKGVGRLQWLKEFVHAKIYSKFLEKNEEKKIAFKFSESGISDLELNDYSFPEDAFYTTVCLSGFVDDKYYNIVNKNLEKFAAKLLSHIILYFLEPEKCPTIQIKAKQGNQNLKVLFDEIKNSDVSSQKFSLKGYDFVIYHIKKRNDSTNKAFLTLTANNRAVKIKSIRNDLGITQSLTDEIGAFSYWAFISSSYLDNIVNNERTDLVFPTNDDEEDLFITSIITEKDLTNAIMLKVQEYFHDLIEKENQLKENKINKFIISNPNYKFLLDKNRFSKKELLNFSIQKDATDEDVENHLFKLKMKIVKEITNKGNNLKLRNFTTKEEFDKYRRDLEDYVNNATDVNKSSLIEYVAHRKVIIELLSKAIKLQDNNTYPKENVIHNLVFPMQCTFDNVLPDENNLWLIDESLSFNSYLASDVPFKKMPIIDSVSDQRPDILRWYDKPLLFAKEKKSPFSSFTIIEFKRPMRDDYSTQNGTDPIEQILKYINELQRGNVKTSSGRKINLNDCPIYCYLIADLTDSLITICENRDLTKNADGNGYFGSVKNKNAFFYVMDYDGLLDSVEKRNKVFFEKLGIS